MNDKIINIKDIVTSTTDNLKIEIVASMPNVIDENTLYIIQ